LLPGKNEVKFYSQKELADMTKIVGAQLFTVRDYTRSVAELDATLKAIREMGYTTIQASGLQTDLPAIELAAIARSHGLKIVLTHMPYSRFVDDLPGLIKDHHTLECDIAGLGSLPADFRSAKAEGYRAFAHKFAAIADELEKNGLKFSYHNHHFEFEKFDGVFGMDILADETPDTFMFTLDTYWLQFAGVNPAHWIKKLAGRVDAIHLKDLSIVEDKQTMAEVLEGNLDWPAIFEASEEARVKWYLVERDAGPTEALESLRISYANLRQHGFA
jgi:sugar phosphate isomerase/epimerase